MTTHTDRETQLLSEMEELSDEIERLKANRAELIGQVERLKADLKRTQDLLSNEIKLRVAAENRITELLTAWNHYS